MTARNVTARLVHPVNVKNVKVCFYIAQSVGPLKALYTDLFIPTPTRLLWEAFKPRRNYVQLRPDYSLAFPSLYKARYSFIQLSELGHRAENEKAQTLKE